MFEHFMSFMKQGAVFLGYPAISLVLSLLLTRLCIRYLPRLGLVDMPGERRIHRTPKPRGGGLAIIVSFFVVFLIYAHGADADVLWKYFFQLLPAAAFLTAVGLLDDRFSLSGKTKLLGQVIAALMVWFLGLRPTVICGIQFNDFVSAALTVFWIVGFVNAFNLIDGMDGLAAGLAVISCLGLVGWSLYMGNTLIAVVIMIFMGSCCGFLRYNFSPAKIFMGDTGSMFLGLFFSTISMSGVSKLTTAVSILVPLLAAGVPLFDVMLAFLRRSLRKFYPNAHHNAGIMTADKDHLHHRLLNRSGEKDDQKKQRHVALLIYVVASVLSVGGFLLMLLIQTMPTVGTISLLVLIFVVVRKFATVELADLAGIMRHGVRKPRKALLLLLAMPFWDIAALAFAHILTTLLLRGAYGGGSGECGACFSVAGFSVMILPTLLMFMLNGVYRMYFLRAAGRSFQRVAECVLGGCFISVVMHYFLFHWSEQGRYCHGEPLLFTLLALLFLLGGRMFMYYTGSYIVGHLIMTGRNDGVLPARTVVVGTGLMCKFFLEYIYSGVADSPVLVLGLIDDDRALRNLELYGYRVLGGSDDVERLYKEYRFDRIVVSSGSYPKTKLEKLEKFCRIHDVDLMRINFQQNLL